MRTAEHFHQRALAGPVLTDQCHAFPAHADSETFLSACVAPKRLAI